MCSMPIYDVLRLLALDGGACGALGPRVPCHERSSSSMRGRISPKVMASITRNDVAPFAAMFVSRVTGACDPLEANSTRALATSNRRKPGIIETTAEKPSAAMGKCGWSTTGVTMMLTRIQATSAPVATFVPRDQRPELRWYRRSRALALLSFQRSHSSNFLASCRSKHPAGS